MRSPLALATCLALTLAPVVHASGPDYPNVVLVSSPDKPIALNVMCAPIAPRDGHQRVHCQSVYTVIRLPPTRDEIEKDIADAEVALKTRPEAFPKACSNVARAADDVDDTEKSLLAAERAACSSHSAADYMRAYADFQRQDVAHTCEIDHMPSTGESDFERMDANTWISSEGPSGPCHVTSVETLWRASGETVWNERMVTTAPEAAKETTCASLAGTHVQDYRWRNVRREFGCRYFRM